MAITARKREEAVETVGREEPPNTETDNVVLFRLPFASKQRGAETARSSRSHARADKYHARGLELAEQGTRANEPNLLKQAEEEFVKALKAVPATGGTIAFRRRVTINLALIRSRLGQASDAVTMLEQVRDELIGDADWLLDAPRALDSLGTAYSRVKRLDLAIDAYKAALDALDRNPWRGNRDRTRLRARILSNLASAYLDAGLPELAYDNASEALGLLSRTDDPLSFGRTLRIFGEALLLRAGALANEAPDSPEKEDAACDALHQAIEVFEDARQLLRQHEAVTDWAAITVTLAGTERVLGNLVARDGSDQDGVNHLRRAVTLYQECFPEVKTDASRDSIRVFLAKTLQPLLHLSPEPEDAWLSLSACHQILGKGALPSDYRAILIEANRILFISLILSDTVGTVDRTDRIAAALADFMTSLGLTETEAVPVVAAAFQRRGWSKLLASLQTGRAPLVHPAAKEVVRPAGRSSDIAQQTLSELPPGLSWPPETYTQAHKARGVNIIQFLEDPDGWFPLIQRGVVTRAVLREHDPSAEMAVSNFIRGGRQLPSHLHLPTKKELNDRTLALVSPPDLREATRLHRLAQRRRIG